MDLASTSVGFLLKGIRCVRMKHSVIIPLYNKERYVRRAIESLLVQTKKPYEIIIVDDCSTDNSLVAVTDTLHSNQYLCRNITIRLIKMASNQGPGIARNRGLDVVQGEYVSCLDADDRYDASYLQRADEVIRKWGVDVLFVGLYYEDSGVVWPCAKGVGEFETEKEKGVYAILHPTRSFVRGDIVPGGGNVICRKQVIAEIRYDDTTRAYEDVDFWDRVLRSSTQGMKLNIYTIVDSLLYVSEVRGSLSRRKISDVSEMSSPAIVTRLSGCRDMDDIRFRKIVCMRWFFSSLMQLVGVRQRISFVVKFRRMIIENLTWNRYFFGALLCMLFGSVLAEVVGEGYKRLYYSRVSRSSI